MNSLDPQTIFSIMRDLTIKKNYSALKQYQNHTNPTVRKYIFNCITNFAIDDELIEFYTKGINDVESGVRLAVIQSIIQMDRAWGGQNYLSNKKYDYNTSAEGSNREKYLKNYVPIVIQGTKDEKQSVVQESIDALSVIGDPNTLGYLVQLYKSGLEYVSENAKKAVNAGGWGNIESKGLPPVIEALKDKNLSVKKGAISILALAGEQGIKHIISSLKDSHPEVRMASCSALTNTNDVFYLQELIAMSKDRDESVRNTVKYCIRSLLDAEPKY